MKTNDYKEQMNDLPLVKLSPDYNGELKHGMLIGFKGLGEQAGITAAYPIWSFIKSKSEIQFVLFTKDNGHHVIDNTWLTSHDLYINESPITVNLQLNNISSF